MRIARADGIVFRVQFVHSAHDPKHPIAGAPGGLRQIVDDLAVSLRRRVTLCEVSVEVPETVQAEDGSVGVQLTVVPLGYGYSVCHYFDQFVKAEGRKRSFERAAKAARLDAGTKNDLALGLCL